MSDAPMPPPPPDQGPSGGPPPGPYPPPGSMPAPGQYPPPGQYPAPGAAPPYGQPAGGMAPGQQMGYGAPPPPQNGGMSGAAKVLIVLGVLFVLGLGGCVALVAVAGTAVSEGIEEAVDARAADEALVEDNSTITSCEVGDFETATATVEFTSPFDEEKGWIAVEVNFLTDGVVVGSGTAVFENLSAGQKAIGEATAFDLADGVTSVTCEVVDGTVL